jgi:hypothetical protein
MQSGDVRREEHFKDAIHKGCFYAKVCYSRRLAVVPFPALMLYSLCICTWCCAVLKLLLLITRTSRIGLFLQSRKCGNEV